VIVLRGSVVKVRWIHCIPLDWEKCQD